MSEAPRRTFCFQISAALAARPALTRTWFGAIAKTFGVVRTISKEHAIVAAAERARLNIMIHFGFDYRWG